MIIRFILKRLHLWILPTISEEKQTNHDGISLCDVNWNDLDDQEFFRETKRALQLIADTDPRRYQRVKDHVDFIVNIESAALATYNPGNICKVDFGKYDFPNHPEWSHYMYAATLIHEATHGYLRSKKFRYVKRNRLRIERICRSEENHFLSRIESAWGDALRKPFNPRDWDPISRFRRTRKQFQRIRESRELNRAQQDSDGQA